MGDQPVLPPSNDLREEVIAAWKALRDARRALQEAEVTVEEAERDYGMKHDWLVGSERDWNDYVASAEFKRDAASAL